MKKYEKYKDAIIYFTGGRILTLKSMSDMDHLIKAFGNKHKNYKIEFTQCNKISFLDLSKVTHIDIQ